MDIRKTTAILSLLGVVLVGNLPAAMDNSKMSSPSNNTNSDNATVRFSDTVKDRNTWQDTTTTSPSVRDKTQSTFDTGTSTFSQDRDKMGRDKQGVLTTSNQGVVIKVREFVRSEPALVGYVDTFDVIDCNGTLFVFGVVDSEARKTSIETKIRDMNLGQNVQTKVVVHK